VFDTTNGPITVGAGAWVQPFTRLEGPCYIGPKTQLFRANLRGGVTLGPNCRIGGEVEASIGHGHTNKYHEGFLGHAYVGEWVNLGAITSNSDLRNDYAEVAVPLQGDPIATGQAKVGCFLGDHTRTGLGSMLNTGTSVGVMCNVLPAGPLLPKHVPSFAAVLYPPAAPGCGRRGAGREGAGGGGPPPGGGGASPPPPRSAPASSASGPSSGRATVAARRGRPGRPAPTSPVAMAWRVPRPWPVRACDG